jgi:DNA-binding NtrC family response regulator
VADHDATLKRLPRFAEPSTVPPAFLLTVQEGPDRGHSCRIEASHPGPILIGTSPACNFRLSDRSVSRRHVALEAEGFCLRVRDLGSTNGTRVDNVRLIEGMLSPGQSLAIGGTIVHVDVQPGSAAELSPELRFGRVLGQSQEMRKLFPLFERLAGSHFPVVIEGETGTGKERLAESLHELGPRAEGSFVVFDCTAVPADLVEMELFGDARVGHAGVFQRAHGGTLFFDEIGDMDLATQPKLLRAIEAREVRPLGSAQPLFVDVRILVSTHRDLDRDVEEGRFRDDLFHRLAVARVELPPLRRRRGDVTLLAKAFAAELGSRRPLPDALLSRWESYAWPGNVRELRNAVTRHIALGDLSIEEVPPPTASGDFLDAVVAASLPLPTARERVVEEFERRYVAHALQAQGGNVSRAAAASGIAHRYFQALRKKRGVARGDE